MRIGKLLLIGSLGTGCCALGFFAFSWLSNRPVISDNITAQVEIGDLDHGVEDPIVEPAIIDLEPSEPARAYFPDAVELIQNEEALKQSDGADGSTNDRIAQVQEVTEKPKTVAVPKNATPIGGIASSDELKRKVIARALPHATQEERDIWFQELKGLDSTMIEEILQLRTRLGRIQTTPNDVVPDSIANNAAKRSTATRKSALSPSAMRKINAMRRATLRNLANVNTVGYKREIVETGEINDELFSAESAEEPGSSNDGTAVRRRVDVSQGELKETDRSLDIAIDGPGWIVLQEIGGKEGLERAYTRAGTLHIDERRELVVRFGGKTRHLLSKIFIPKNTLSIKISETGTVAVERKSDKTTGSTYVGTIELARFLNPSELHRNGDGTFTPTTASGDAIIHAGEADGYGTIRQGTLELSNSILDSETDVYERLEKIQYMLIEGASLMNRHRSPVGNTPATKPANPLTSAQRD